MDLPQLASEYRLPGPPLDPESGQHVPPGRLFGVLRRRKFLVLGTIAALLGPAILLIYGIEPYYDATALLMLDTRKSSFRDLQATVATPDTDLLAIATQVGLIRSPALAARLVDRLDLTHQPEFVRQMDAPPSLPRRLVLAALGDPDAARGRLSDPERRELAAAILLDKLSVLNDGKSYIISIRARTGDARLSASIANTYVELYLDFKQQQKIAAIHRASALLDEQISPLSARVTAADQAVATYREHNGLILNRATADGQDDAAGGTTVADQQLAQINSQLITATADLAQKQASLRQIDVAMRAGHLDAIPDVVASPLIASLRAQQAELSSRAASLAQSQSFNNPTLRAAQAAAAEVQQRINAEIGKIAASVRSQAGAAEAQVEGLKATLSRLQGQVGTQSQANVALRQLESEARAARTIYQDYLGRFEQTLNQSNLQEAEADQVSAAEIPIAKSGPPRTLYLLLAGLASTGLAVLLALLTERLRPGIRTIEELETRTGLFGLGFVPIAPDEPRRLFAAAKPSIYGESVSIVGNLLRFGQERYRAQVVLVTSAVPGEGKTTFAVSLAASAGREGRAALLIDCDMRRPSVARVLGLAAAPERGDNVATLRQSVLPGLDVVTFQPLAGGARARVGAAQMQRLLEEARSRYDMIVLDTPPVLPFADTPILSLKADGAILVVRWRHTPVAVVNSALRMLGSYGVRVLGGVVTRVRLKDVAAEDSGHAYMYRHYAAYFR